ncbi:hypothetical protein BJ165DRAFT_1120469 [Panaeolus papilionaceus]|nr:hypothetical protein BJ165DRAFT_1120469 [Panaeolus papilionaceus]
MHATLYKFLVVMRTDEEIRALLDDMSECTCSLEDLDRDLSIFHQFCFKFPGWDTDSPSLLTTIFLERTFNELSSTIFPESCVTQWAFRIFKVCGALTYAPFDKHDVTNNIFVHHMRQVIDTIVASSPSDIVRKPMADFLSHVTSFLGFMTGIVAGPQGQHPIRCLVKGSETKALQLCSMMPYVLDGP